MVGIWSALEVLCEDFAVAWLANVPQAWEVAEITKLRVPIALYQSIPPDERPRFVIRELARNLNMGLRKGVGKLRVLLAVFNLAPAVGPNLQRAIHELFQVRNVIVHAGSRVDQKIIDECPWLQLRLGETVKVTHEVYGWYCWAAKRYAERVLNQAFLVLGLPGCECPGMDEVDPRPAEETTVHDHGSSSGKTDSPNPVSEADS